jgi:membrane fusion protein (multidrug efflux system)
MLVAAVVAAGGGLAAWKVVAAQGADAAGAQAEPMETVTDAVATRSEYLNTTTSIGTVVATRSVSLRNEVPGTVHRADLVPGQIVEADAVLVALDVSVEEAELQALQARAELARTTLARYERMAAQQAASAIELDNARAERDVAEAEVARTRAIIERKTIRAPFRARVGISDVHTGQFLEAGTLLTTLQGVDDGVNIDFAVPQAVAAGLSAGSVVQVLTTQDDVSAVPARVTAVDALVDRATRNAVVRARIEHAGSRLIPGASVRVRAPVGRRQDVVVVPVSGLRKGPEGDHVFVLEASADGQLRARLQPVAAGPVLGDSVVILSGVGVGDRVATSGSFKLRDGILVNVADGAAVATPEEEG